MRWSYEKSRYRGLFARGDLWEQGNKTIWRRRYLGTLRERVVLLLTKAQVMQETGLDELTDRMTENKEDGKLLLNGEISYRFLSPYKDAAEQNDIHHTTVSNPDIDTDVGAVLTVDYAIEKEHIYVEPKKEREGKSDEVGGVKGFLKSLFKPSK